MSIPYIGKPGFSLGFERKDSDGLNHVDSTVLEAFVVCSAHCQ
jgi:hypothetical protein